MAATSELQLHLVEPALSGALRVIVFQHPQGCRSFLLNDPSSGQTLALDVHLDSVDVIGAELTSNGWTLPYVVDTHTHADHPSGAAELAQRFGSTRIAHESSHHAGVTRHPADGDTLHLGDQVIRVLHCPGHTPDHIALLTSEAAFTGDTLLIGSVARTDFLGGDAGQLFDSIHRLLAELPDQTNVFPSHDYNGKVSTTIGEERRSNPWLQVTDRDEFIRSLTANPPPRPANIDELLRLNREGDAIPMSISVAAAIERVRQGGAVSVLDVRSGVEFESESIEGSVHVPLDQLRQRVDEARAVPAPRMLLCKAGTRAKQAQAVLGELGLGGLTVVEGGIDAYRRAGGETHQSNERMSLERQVRIAAGSLVLLGVLLGFLMHPFLFGLAGFVGAGLIFAGVTDWCGMGLLLARMPWNRAKSSTGATAGGTCAANAPAACAAGAPPASCAASIKEAS